MVLGDVDVVVSELGAFMVEGIGIRDHFLEIRGVDFIADCFAIDGISGGFVKDFEGAGGVIIGV